MVEEKEKKTEKQEEQDKERRDIDQITKRLIKEFFKEFLSFFFPELVKQIDFSSVVFIDKELFSGQVQGPKNIADVLAEIKLSNGEEKIALCHIEIQSEKEAEFPERMYSYFNNIWMEHKKPVFAFALFLDKKKWRVPVKDEFKLNFMGTELRYKYHLRKSTEYLYKNYLDHENPITAALMARMNFGKDSAGLVKAIAMKKIKQYGLSPLQEEIISNFIEKLLFLEEKEKKEFNEIIKQEEYKEVQVMITTWEEKGIEKGIEKGKVEVVKKALEAGLGIDIIAKITGLDLEVIKSLKNENK